MTNEENYERLERLEYAFYKLMGWSGTSVSDLIENELIEEDDLPFNQ